MKPKEIARRIYHKDTCYGMYDDKDPTDKELIEYFTTWIEDYAREFHEEQSIKDVEIKKEEDENKLRWWNNA